MKFVTTLTQNLVVLTAILTSTSGGTDVSMESLRMCEESTHTGLKYPAIDGRLYLMVGYVTGCMFCTRILA